MLRRKKTRELGMLTTQNPSDHHYLGQISIESSIEPELQSLGTETVSLNEDSERRDDSFGSEKKFGLQDYFVCKEWHGPYVKAVCGTDEVKREAIVAEAERAIVDRFLELIVSAVETDEILDLQSAAYAITQLKIASPVVNTPQHFVA